MILEKSRGYWATGITVRYRPPSETRKASWGALLEFFDDGWVDDDNASTGAVSTEGRLCTRYYVQDGADGASGLQAALDALISDASRIGISLCGPSNAVPRLYVRGDGEYGDKELPDGWRDVLREQAERIGWATYGYEPTLYCWALWDEHWQELVSMTSGYLLRTPDDAIQELAEGAGDLAWMREHNRVERITEERWDRLDGWDELTEDEKAALRPVRDGV